MAVLDLAMLVAEGQGRGGNPDEGVGVGIIVAIVVGVALAAFLGHFLIHRFGRTRPQTQEAHPDQAGRVGRVGEFRDG